MFRTTVTAGMMSLMFAAVACGDDEFEIKVYPAEPAGEVIKLDGIMDESAWNRAPLAGGVTLFDQPRLVEVQTFFRVGYDNDNLYIGVHCDEPLMEKLVPVAALHDAEDVFRDEAIELFVDPKHDHQSYYQFAIGCGGGTYDSQDLDKSWNSGLKAKTLKDQTGWTAEAALPWKAFGITPKPGMVVGLNVCRNRRLGPEGLQFENWSQTSGGFHDPQRFGHVVLSPANDDLKRLEIEFRQGGKSGPENTEIKRTGPLAIYSHDGFSGRSYLSRTTETLAEAENILRDLTAVAGEMDAVTQQKLSQIASELTSHRKMAESASLVSIREWCALQFTLQKLAPIEETSAGYKWKKKLDELLKQL